MGEIERRVERLEAAQLVRRPIAVITCQNGHEDEAADAYWARTPENEQPKLLVIIRRFTKAAYG